MSKYKVTARVKDSKCPNVKAGDQVVLEGTTVNLKETTSLCAVALGAIQYSLQLPGPGDKGDLRNIQEKDGRMSRRGDSIADF